MDIQQRLSRLINSIAVVLGIAGVVLTVLGTLYTSDDASSIFVGSKIAERDERISNLERQIEALQADVSSEGSTISEVDSSRVVAIEDRQKALDEALSQNADRVIALATMRSDLDDLDDSQARQAQALESQIAELRTILLGLAASLIAILLAVVGWLVVRNSEKK